MLPGQVVFMGTRFIALRSHQAARNIATATLLCVVFSFLLVGFIGAGPDFYLLHVTGDCWLQYLRPGRFGPDLASAGKFQLIIIPERNVIRDEPVRNFSAYPSVLNVRRMALTHGDVYGEADDHTFFYSVTERTLTQGKRGQQSSADSAIAAALRDPAQLATSVSARQLRPQDWTQMDGLAGLPDTTWAWIVEAAGVSAAVLGGLCIAKSIGVWHTLRRPALIVIGLLIGIISNYVANILILDSGPDSFVGLLTLPWVDAFLAGFSFDLREHIASVMWQLWKRCHPPVRIR